MSIVRDRQLKLLTRASDLKQKDVYSRVSYTVASLNANTKGCSG